MLNILETFPLPDYHLSGVEAMHWKIEAQKLAYADRAAYLGDPAVVTAPLQMLLSKDYAAIEPVAAHRQAPDPAGPRAHAACSPRLVDQAGP